MQRTAVAGKREKGDTHITLSTRCGANEIVITSPVLDLFGPQIRTAVEQTLQQLQISGVLILVEDNQALDCVTQARLRCAVQRLQRGVEA
ncbi:MAG: citrate lyase subunit gamma [Sphaerochaeta sp.]|nr:citrate lyase subunit gamma [Sphaerochaeta sp.]